ncbi:hypothetical protein H5410_028716 [Solanum commersonii]|uniref:Uncharacterized protein n=1 Tax=Solanum commersonii TaxID=4109 RepID=A0A9J5Z5L6_SOLCO|nr:hypothetical protein H5410_028716 [Solanum commersonii]
MRTSWSKQNIEMNLIESKEIRCLCSAHFTKWKTIFLCLQKYRKKIIDKFLELKSNDRQRDHADMGKSNSFILRIS